MLSRFEPQEEKCTAVYPDEKILPTAPPLALATFQCIFQKREGGIRPVSPRGTSGPLGRHGRGKAPLWAASGYGR